MLRLDKGEKKLMKTIHGFTHGIPHILPPPPTTTNRPHLPLASCIVIYWFIRSMRSCVIRYNSA